MWSAQRLIKYSAAVGGILLSAASFKQDQSKLDSNGFVRLSRAAYYVLGITLIYKTQLYNMTLEESSTEYLEMKSRVHKLAADRLLELCFLNRGIYIKVGQHLGALDYVLPKEYVETMKILHNHAPDSTLQQIFQVLREDLKQEPCEIFTSFEGKPLGTASLAQVHKAVLKDGAVVAVKVQHPHVREHAVFDMKTMEVLADFMAWTFPDFKFGWLVEEIKLNLPLELDFTHEARNAEKVNRLFADVPWLRIPCVVRRLTATRVLTMQYMPGGPVNDLEYIKAHNISPVEVSEKLGALYSDMIFLHGFVHSDPHPGNILVHKEPPDGQLEIVLLDHGLYAELTNDFRWEYSKLWLSILNKDEAGIRRHGERLGVGELYHLLACMVTGRVWQSIVGGVEKTEMSDREKDAYQEEVPKLLPQISDVLTKVDRQVLLLLKTNDLLRSIERTLKTEHRMSSFLVMSRSCVKSVYGERFKACRTQMCRFRTAMSERWALLKLSLSYAYLTVKAFNVWSLIT